MEQIHALWDQSKNNFPDWSRVYIHVLDYQAFIIWHTEKKLTPFWILASRRAETISSRISSKPLYFSKQSSGECNSCNRQLGSKRLSPKPKLFELESKTLDAGICLKFLIDRKYEKPKQIILKIISKYLSSVLCIPVA